MNRYTIPLASCVLISLWTARLDASHVPQVNGPVSSRIVEDVWSSPEFCLPCMYEDTEFFVRTLRIETSVGHITGLSVRVDGILNQTGDGFSLARDSDTHFLFDEAADTLDVVSIHDDQQSLSGTFSGFVPFTRRDVAHLRR